MNKQELSPASPPLLSPQLNTLYQSLTEDNKHLFVKVFKYLWGVVLPSRRFIGRGAVLYSYWAVDLLRERQKLPPRLLSLLTFIYFITDKGRKYINTNQVYNSSGVLPDLDAKSKQAYLSHLTQRGYIVRSRRNTDDPYYQRSYARRPVFIRLSPSGLALIEGIEKDLYKILMRSTLEDLTGNKKP